MQENHTTDNHSNQPTFCVLMATFNGGQYLDRQLQSIAAQSVALLDVFISDDGSDDDTMEIVEKHSRNWVKGNFTSKIRTEKERIPGALASCSNFKSLISQTKLDFEFYAFSDQDDIWDADKLQEAADWFANHPKDKPALFCSRVRVANAVGEDVGFSSDFSNKAAFENAIVQNVVAGNTLVLNKPAMMLVQRASQNVDFVSHDWWSYLVISGAGGTIYFSPNAKISYRRHSGNLVGDDGTKKAYFRKIKMMLSGKYKTWNDLNMAALAQIDDLLTAKSKQTLATFLKARNSGPINGPVHLKKSRVFRQSAIGQLTLYLSSILGKL